MKKTKTTMTTVLAAAAFLLLAAIVRPGVAQEVRVYYGSPGVLPAPRLAGVAAAVTVTATPAVTVRAVGCACPPDCECAGLVGPGAPCPCRAKIIDVRSSARLPGVRFGAPAAAAELPTTVRAVGCACPPDCECAKLVGAGGPCPCRGAAPVPPPPAAAAAVVVTPRRWVAPAAAAVPAPRAPATHAPAAPLSAPLYWPGSSSRGSRSAAGGC